MTRAESTVFNRNGEQIQLISTKKGGKEGKICEIVGDKLQCAKIFHPNKRVNELHEKILAMINNPPTDPTWQSRRHRSITWPNDIIYQKKNQFIGYTMPYMDTETFKESHMCFGEDRIKEFGEDFSWRNMFSAAYNITSTVTYIHKKGHCIGDLRGKNILVSKDTLITLIDCDSFQIRDRTTGKIFYTEVGDSENQPPELINVDFEDKSYGRYYSDLFALGILIFKFLMIGTHPFAAKGPLVDDTGSIEAKIEKGYFPYRNIKGVEPPDHAPPYDIIPPNIKTLFYRCFVLGYKDPNQRPTANEWFAALGKEI